MTTANVIGEAKRIRGLTFKEWMREVDRALVAKCGLTSDDLPDYCYADAYDDRKTPRTTAVKAIKAAGGEGF